MYKALKHISNELSNAVVMLLAGSKVCVDNCNVDACALIYN